MYHTKREERVGKGKERAGMAVYHGKGKGTGQELIKGGPVLTKDQTEDEEKEDKIRKKRPMVEVDQIDSKGELSETPSTPCIMGSK